MKKPVTIMLVLISLFSFFGCRSQPAGNKRTAESEAERTAAFEQHPNALYPIRKKDKWGYMNRKTEIIIQPQFDDATDFTDGYAAVAQYQGENLKYGYIDSAGKMVTEIIYEKAGHFSEGKARVQKDGLCGYIDETGAVVIPFKFHDASHFSEGFAAIKQEGRVGFINQDGEVVIQPQYTVSIDHPYFKGGLAPVFGNDEKTGFIDTAGNWAIENKFYSASIFREGKAWALYEENAPETEYGFRIRGGYLNPDGTWAIEPQYDFGWDFTEGHAVAWSRSEDKTQKIWKLIDHEGNVLLDHLPYRNVGALNNGVIPIQDEELHWGFMNIKGEVVIPPKYSGINHFKNGLARMEVGNAFSNKIVYINIKGEEVWKE